MVSTTPTIDFLKNNSNSNNQKPENFNEIKLKQVTKTTSIYGNSNIQTVKKKFSLNKNNNNSKKNKRAVSPPNIESTSSTTIYHQGIVPNHLSQLTQEQDIIVRHIASLYIANHVDPDDLLVLSESKPKKFSSFYSSTSTTTSSPSPSSFLWKKVKLYILHTSSVGRVGVSLTNYRFSVTEYKNHNKPALDRWIAKFPCVAPCFSENAQVPGFLKDCILATVDKDISTEGIFRKNGNIRGLNQMCETINNTKEKNNNWFDYFQQQSIIQLAAFIKRFLRDLPEPLFTFKLYKLFCYDKSESLKIQIIHHAVCMLPKPNRDVLLLLLAFLNWVSKHSEVNKMNADNLARVMAPNMLYLNNGSVQDAATTCHAEMKVVSLMIQHFDKLSVVPNQLEYIENDKLPMTNTI